MRKQCLHELKSPSKNRDSSLFRLPEMERERETPSNKKVP